MLQAVTILATLSLLLMIISLMRKGSLREEHALGWLGGTLAVAVVVLFPGLLNEVAQLMGIRNPPNLLLGFAMYVLALITLRQQVQISQIRDREKVLAQELAILRLEIQKEAEGK